MTIKKKDLNDIIFIFWIIFINVPIQYFTSFQSIKYVYLFLQIIIFITLFLRIIKYKKKNNYAFLLTMYYACLIFSTLINKGQLENIVTICRGAILCVNLSFLIILYEKEEKKLLSVTSLYLTTIIYINFITILIFPDGIYIGSNINPHYFLGQRNDAIEYILPAILCKLFYNEKYERKKNSTVLLLCICLTTVITTWSANAIVAIISMYLWFVFSSKGKWQIINPLRIFITSFLISYSIICLEIQYYFSWFIEKFLGKSMTFTGRSKLWSNSLSYIENSFIYGYGKESVLEKTLKIGHGNSAHNYFLDFLYEGGIILLFLIFLMILEMNKVYKKNTNLKLKKISMGILIGYFIIWIATPIHINTISQMFFCFFLIIYVLSRKDGVNFK